MRDTEVLLREHVKGLGKCGDVVRVAPGFARNYLIPQRIAIQATEENKKAMMRRRERLDVEEAKLMAELDLQVEAYAKVVLETEQRVDDHGRLYVSVNAAMIAALLGEALGKRLGARACNRAQVLDKLLLGHTNARVRNRQRVRVLVRRD